MNRSGSPADTSATRYEQWWALSECVRLLHGATETLRIEALDAGRAELSVTAGTRREIHYPRQPRPAGAWLTTLDAGAGRLLQVVGDRLGGNLDRAVFVSADGAAEIAGPSDAAKGVDSAQAFERGWLTTTSRREWFARLQRYWVCDAAAAYDRLRRIDVRTIAEADLELQVRWGLQALFFADVATVVARLLSIVEGSSQRAMTRRELVERLARRGCRPRRLHGPDRAGDTAATTTDRYLAPARRRLIRGAVMPRTAAAKLAARLEGTGAPSESVLTGKAGAGKTACVVGVTEALRAAGVPVLAFRLDVVASAATTLELGRRLHLEESPVLVLAEAAQAAGRPGVLIVDQVDTLGGPSGDAGGAGNLVERLCHEARGIRARATIHAVVVCRAFDWRNDPGLRRLLPGADVQIDLGELGPEAVEKTLAEAGFDPASFGARRLEILRLPQHLRLFLEGHPDASSAPAFTTAKTLFDRYWNTKRRAVAARAAPLPDQWMEAVRTLCDEMTSAGRSSAPGERLDEVSPAYLEHLAAEGVVTLHGQRCAFGHETVFDYCAARISFNRREALAASLERSGQHPFDRGRLRQVLTYSRDADPSMYVRELEEVLGSKRIRTHVKDLALSLLADVPDPTEQEWRLWEKWLAPALRALRNDAPNADPLSALAWRRFFESPSWFAFADRRGVIEGWLAADDDRLATTAVSYLQWHSGNAPDLVAALLEPYADLGGVWTTRLRSFMEWADHHASRRLFELFLHLVDNGTLDEARGGTASNPTFWSMLDDLSEHRPEWITEVAAHRLRRRLAVIRSAGEDMAGHELPGYDQAAARMFDRTAEHAPGAFAQHVLGPVLDISEATLTGTSPPRRDAVWPLIARTEYPDADHACLSGLAAALGALARGGDATVPDVIADLRARDTHVANLLLLSVYQGGAAHRADEAIALLCDEPWRFQCGFSDSPQWYAAETLRVVTPRCTAASRERLEQVLLDYVAPDERGIRGYRQSGRARFALLSALPVELRSTRANDEVQSLERRFGGTEGERRPIAVDSVESAGDGGAVEAMTDEQWLAAIGRHRSRVAASARGDESPGGQGQLADLLEGKAAVDPDRFARLALKFPAAAHPVYLERTLAVLKSAAVSSDLKLQVCHKAFVESRGPCGRSIAEVLGSIREPLPNDAVRMLHWLATEHEDPATTAWQDEDVGIETARGSAAEAIRRLIVEDASCIPRFRVTVDRLIRDPSASVRACAAGAVRAVADRDPALGMKLMRAMNLSEDALLAASQVYGFIRDSLRERFVEVRPLVERMLKSSEPEVCEAGARLASLAALQHTGAGTPDAGDPSPAVAAMSARPDDRSAADLAAETRHGSPAHRLGVAHVAAANLAIPEYRNWSTATLTALFDDEDDAVRRRAATCFRHVKDAALDAYDDLIEAFCRSRAYGDDPASLLHTLDAARERIPGATCIACEQFLDRFAEEARDPRNDRYADALTVATLAFRTCQQHQDDEWTSRCLDLIDRLCLEQIGDARDALERIER